MSERKQPTVVQLRNELGLKPSKENIELMRKAREVQNAITKVLKEGPKTVPEIAEATGIPKDEIFWHLMTMHKYGLVEPEEKDEEGYFRYRLVEG